jgi:hypothetical protein
VNLLKNVIGVDQAGDLVSILKEHPTLMSLCGNKGNETELDMSGKMRGTTDAMMFVPEIVDNGALSILNMSKNGMRGSEAGKAFGDALATNTALRELDLSGLRELDQNGQLYATPNMDAAFVKALAPGLSDNRALTHLDISVNALTQGKQSGTDRKGQPTYETDITGTPYYLLSTSRLSCPLFQRCCGSCQCHSRYGGVDHARHQQQ